LAAGALPARADDALKEKAAADLNRFYQERLGRPFLRADDTPEPKVAPPPWAEPLKQLATGKPEERAGAAAYLRDLLALALAHETGRTAPWRNTPFWGGGAEVPARVLRKQVADELAKAGPLPDALPVLRWYFEAETNDGHLPPVLSAVGKLDGKGADTLRAELASRPHPNAVVAAGAIEQIAARKGSLPADRLAALCHHHRAGIREAARKLNARHGGKDPGPFDPARAVRSEPVKKVMDEVLVLLPDLPGPMAEYVSLTTRFVDDKNVGKEKFEDTGWLVRRHKDLVAVYTPFGRPESARPGEKKRVEHSEKSKDGEGWVSSQIDITVVVDVTPAKIEDEIRKVEAARKKETAGIDLSRKGGLTGQFEGDGATLYEAIFGAWLYRAGRDADAARVLLPALDSLYADRHLAEMVRHRMGDLAGFRMLVAFAGDRDYKAALGQAKLIDRLYPDTRFHVYAKGLADQFPRRADDFQKLKLPTPAEWADLKKKLTREQQVNYLCARLRLLNCFQMGQPGGYDPDAKQYAEPCGMADDASWGLGLGKTEVINPLVELRGPANWYGDKPRAKGLELTVKDVPVLSKHLKDDWYMPTVEFWRNFHPDRTLETTRPQVAELIDELACKDVCHVDRWGAMTPAEIDNEIERINRWAAENADKDERQLRWEALDEQVKAGAPWGRLENARRLFELKDERLRPVLRKHLDETKSEYDLHSLLYWCLEFDPAAFKDQARRFAKHQSIDLRLAAGHILFAAGEHDEARKVFADILENGSPWKLEENALPKLVEVLLKEGSEASKRTARLVFKNKRYTEIRERRVRVSLVRKCAAAGIGDGYLSYLPLLDIKGNTIGNISYGTDTVVGEVIAGEIVDLLAPNDAEIVRIKQTIPKPGDRIPPLKEWLTSKAKALAAAEPAK
jgi:hypothetical protein